MDGEETESINVGRVLCRREKDDREIEGCESSSWYSKNSLSMQISLLELASVCTELSTTGFESLTTKDSTKPHTISIFFNSRMRNGEKSIEI